MDAPTDGRHETPIGLARWYSRLGVSRLLQICGNVGEPDRLDVGYNYFQQRLLVLLLVGSE